MVMRQMKNPSWKSATEFSGSSDSGGRSLRQKIRRSKATNGSEVPAQKQRMRNDTAEKLLRPAATSHPTGT